MNRIHLLPEQVANQIAAGEVVERPASAVNELVENALDAEATRILVEIQAGGRSLVRVTDDGVGMSRDAALLCLERHATSKIRRAEDLAAIATMGFRGEALPSIASVSRFVLTTRERESASPEGTQVVINAGKIVSVKAASAASGTTVEVRQLFFNLPRGANFCERKKPNPHTFNITLRWPRWPTLRSPSPSSETAAWCGNIPDTASKQLFFEHSRTPSGRHRPGSVGECRCGRNGQPTASRIAP